MLSLLKLFSLKYNLFSLERWYYNLFQACCLPQMPLNNKALPLDFDNEGLFHLYLSELAFMNQFYSIMTRLVQLSLAND